MVVLAARAFSGYSDVKVSVVRRPLGNSAHRFTISRLQIVFVMFVKVYVTRLLSKPCEITPPSERRTALEL